MHPHPVRRHHTQGLMRLLRAALLACLACLAAAPALAQVQARMLDALWPLLAPGGRLLFATCSVFPAEGRQQIDAFLQRLGPGKAMLEPQSPGHLLPSRDNASEAIPAGPDSRSPLLQDGFFYALIRKT